MAYTSTHTGKSAIPSFWNGLGAALSTLGKKFVSIGENHPRMKRIEALQALSDEELAKRGLTRATIMRHVFADSYYI